MDWFLYPSCCVCRWSPSCSNKTDVVVGSGALDDPCSQSWTLLNISRCNKNPFLKQGWNQNWGWKSKQAKKWKREDSLQRGLPTQYNANLKAQASQQNVLLQTLLNVADTTHSSLWHPSHLMFSCWMLKGRRKVFWNSMIHFYLLDSHDKQCHKRYLWWYSWYNGPKVTFLGAQLILEPTIIQKP